PARNSAKSRIARTCVMGSESGPPEIELRTDDRHRHLVALVEELPAELDDAAVGLARREARLEHGAAKAQRIARPYRHREAPLLDARRADARGFVEVGVAHEPHQHAAGVPAGSDQAAEWRRLRRERIGMEALRVPVGCEADDFLLGERARAVFEAAPDGEVFPVVAKAHSRSSSHEVARPRTRPQKGAPIRIIGTSATVTRKQTSAPSV